MTEQKLSVSLADFESLFFSALPSCHSIGNTGLKALTEFKGCVFIRDKLLRKKLHLWPVCSVLLTGVHKLIIQLIDIIEHLPYADTILAKTKQ